MEEFPFSRSNLYLISDLLHLNTTITTKEIFITIAISVHTYLSVFITVIHVFNSLIHNSAFVLIIMTYQLFMFEDIWHHLSSHYWLVSRDKMASSLNYHLDEIFVLLYVASDLKITILILKLIKPSVLFIEVIQVSPLNFLHPFLNPYWTIKQIKLAWMD